MGSDDIMLRMNEEFNFYEDSPKKIYSKIETNKVFIGCCIKSEYDENRIKIKENHNPKRVFHCGKNFYGVLFEPNKAHLFLLKYLINYKSFDLYSFSKVLKENNLSCEENYAYLEKNLYPVDTKHIYAYIPDFKYESFFDDNLEIPMYQRIKSINMFFLTPE